MGYLIVYENAHAKKTNIKRIVSTKKHFVLWTVILLAFVSICWIGWNQTDIRQYLLPGDPDFTSAAIDGLIEEIRNGAAVSDAVFAFCEEIVDHAKYE